MSTTQCECGNRKASSAHACPRCTYLDGTKLAALAIESLRDTRDRSLRELALDIFGEADHDNGLRSLLRTMQVLERAGRVRRFQGEGVEAEQFAFGKRTVRRCATNWVYRLAARAA